MRKKIFTFLLALAASVGMSWADVIPCTAADLGKVLCTDGSIYATVSEASAASKTAAAVIAYVDTENAKALALALADDGGEMEWATAKTTAAAHTPAVSGGTWTLASKDDWDNMINAAVGYEALRDGFSGVGGTNMNEDKYWSSTPENAYAWCYYFDYGMWVDGYVDNPCRVRACLAFDIPAEPQLAVAYTLQLHVNDALMGSVALQDPSNDIFDFGDGTYAVPEGATVTLIATPNEGYEFTGWKASSSICDFNECEFVALPTNDNPLTVDMYQEAAFMAEFAAVAPADNSVKLYHNFFGDWMETEAFGIFDDYTSEYAKISMILEPGDYQFALKVGGELRGDGTAFSRDKQACILAEGFTANLTLNVDVKGTYGFYWFYDENRFAMNVPNVCGMYWKDVTAGNFEVTLGQEGEVTLPTVFTTNMGFAYNIFNGVDQVRLVSTDETVATIEYTLSLDGLGTITIHKAGECDIYAVHDITDSYCYDSCAFHLTVLPEPAPQPQPQIGPKEVLDLGTTGCVGEHYQLTGGGTNIYRTVGGVDNKMITIESLHGEIIDNISLKLYYYNVWTGYSVAASSGDVSSWNYDAYEDLVITNINATSVTLSRVGSGQENGYVMFEKVTINNSDEPEPQPAEDVNIIPNVDPDHAGVYYSTFYDSANKYALPANVEAYVATRDGANLLLSKIADAGQTIPADNAVILKSTVTPFTLSISDAEAVTFTATNDLQGTDESINTPANCYVLAGNDGVGFYHYTASMLNPHKAYVIYSGSQAPHRMPFVFNQATGVENVQGDNVQSTKVIENGVLYIIKNGVKYNAMGQPVNQ